MPLNWTKNANNYISGKGTFFPDNYNHFSYLTPPERGPPGGKNGAVWAQNSNKIGNIEENNAVGVLKFLQYVV